MRIGPKEAYFLLLKNPPLSEREIEFLSLTLRRIPIKEISNLLQKNKSSIYRIERRIYFKCYDPDIFGEMSECDRDKCKTVTLQIDSK